MNIEKVIIITAVLAAAAPCIAGPLDPPRHYPPPNISNQLRRLQADNQRRQMEWTMREERERNERILSKFQQGERREKQTLEKPRQLDARPQQR
jgi:hypothetical protein